MALTSLLLALSVTLFAEEKITEFNVVSDEWETCTEKDGSGMYFDLMRAIYEPLGIKVEFKLMPYARTVFTVKEKKADAFTASYLNEQEWAVYPKNWFDLDIVLAIFPKGKYKEFKGQSSLEGKKVAWLREFTLDKYLKVKVEHREVNNRQSGFALLDAGKIDFWIDPAVLLDPEWKNLTVKKEDYELHEFLYLPMSMAFANTPKGKNSPNCGTHEWLNSTNLARCRRYIRNTTGLPIRWTRKANQSIRTR